MKHGSMTWDQHADTMHSTVERKRMKVETNKKSDRPKLLIGKHKNWQFSQNITLAQ